MTTRILALIICLLALIPPIQAQEKVYTTDNLPKAYRHDNQHYMLCDPEGILNEAATDSINNMLYRLERQTGIETVVAVVPSIGEADCFDFCHRLLNSWGVGKKGKDNGLIVLLVTDQRCIQFYTGYGLEGVLPDAVCKRIQTQFMIPYLKDERWSEGMTAGIRAVCATLDGSMENDGSSSGPSTEVVISLIFFLFILFLITVAWTKRRLDSRCPRCKKPTLQRAGSRVLSFHNGVKTEEVTYICQHCGHVVKRVERHGSDSSRNRGGDGWGGPIIFGGGFGGFGGGGGFSGGGFGGGTGGGGGAGSRF